MANLISLVLAGKEEELRTRLEDGADATCVDEVERAPSCFYSAAADRWCMMQAGSTLLHVAIEKKDPRIVELILNHGADLEARDQKRKYAFFWIPARCTALHKAVHAGSYSIAEMLLHAGSAVNARDDPEVCFIISCCLTLGKLTCVCTCIICARASICITCQ
jgi:ankyrin repeat protein